MKATQKYLGGMQGDGGASRSYEITITEEGEHKGKVIILNTFTPKLKNGNWGKQQNEYRIANKGKFKTIKEALDA